MRAATSVLIAWGVLVPALAYANSAGDRLVACHKIADAPKRLECYDDFAALLLKKAAAAPAPREWTGSGIKTTRPFHMDAGWVLEWKTAGAILSIDINTANGQPIDSAMQTQPGEGHTFEPKGGEFTLHIAGVGAWRVAAVRAK